MTLGQMNHLKNFIIFFNSGVLAADEGSPAREK